MGGVGGLENSQSHAEHLESMRSVMRRSCQAKDGLR